MRESYFASNVHAVRTALAVPCELHSEGVQDLLAEITVQLDEQLSDEASPEAEWRRATAHTLQCFADLMRGLDRPTPSVESLVREMSC